MPFKAKSKIPKKNLRDIPGWKDAPIPLCMGGDYRALSWCCKPGYSLTFGFKCLRDEKLKEIGITPEEFKEIKDKFSDELDWDSDFPCFGSLTYCCMRRGGCRRRDMALAEKFPGMSYDEAYEKYAKQKKRLANIILKKAKKQDLVKDYIDE